jgi:methylated-DNA-protein-cysteine methyltransferase-like protein
VGVVESAEVARRILACVEIIPRGRVMTYGDVAEYVGDRGPRFVGRVLAENGDGVAGDEENTVPWHRVLRADGHCAPHLYRRQRELLLAEGVPFRGERVVLRECRWDGRSNT